MTGEYFDAAIFIGPCAEQRLQKFVLDDEQSVAGSGPTDATTGQPLGGKHVQGGLKLGEMEHWGLESHGSMINLFEKTHSDSDHRKTYICRGCGPIRRLQRVPRDLRLPQLRGAGRHLRRRRVEVGHPLPRGARRREHQPPPGPPPPRVRERRGLDWH